MSDSDIQQHRLYVLNGGLRLLSNQMTHEPDWREVAVLTRGSQTRLPDKVHVVLLTTGMTTAQIDVWRFAEQLEKYTSLVKVPVSIEAYAQAAATDAEPTTVTVGAQYEGNRSYGWVKFTLVTNEFVDPSLGADPFARFWTRLGLVAPSAGSSDLAWIPIRRVLDTGTVRHATARTHFGAVTYVHRVSGSNTFEYRDYPVLPFEG